MQPSEFDIDTVRALVDRSKSRPESVELSTVFRLIESPNPKFRRMGLEMVGHIVTDRTRADAVLSTVCDRFEDEDLQVRYNAIRSISDIYPHCADEINTVVPRLIDRLDDTSMIVQQSVLSTLIIIAREDPSAVERATPRVVSFLDSDETQHRERAITLLAEIASEHPERVRRARPRLIELVGEVYEEPEIARERESQRTHVIRGQERQERLRYQRIRVLAALILTEIVRTAPEIEHVRPVVTELSAHLKDDDRFVQEAVIDLYLSVGEHAPEVLLEVQSILIDVLLDDCQSDSIRGKTAWALAHAAEVDTEGIVRSLGPAADTLHSLLTCPESDVRRGAVGLLSYVAEECPDAAALATDQLIDLLGDQNEAVRGNAILTLGFIECGDCLDELKEVKTDDPDLDVREAAATAIDRIESGS